MKLKNIIIYPFALLMVLTQSCSENKAEQNETKELQGTVSISGAFALYPLVVTWRNEFQKLHPKVKIDVVAGGAGKGIAEALSHHVNLGMVSREVKPDEINQGAWALTVAKDAVLPTINSGNPYIKEIFAKGITQEQFRKIFIEGTIKTWGEVIGNSAAKENIQVFTRSDASGAADTWGKYLGGAQEDFKGIGVFGDPGIAEAVRRDKLAIGYNNIAYVYDLKTQKPHEGLEVIPIDLNGNGKIDSTENFYEDHHKIINAIAHNLYPAPPSRELYFVSNGPPKDPIIKEFFKWILTDGQQYVPEAGYIRLSQNKVKAEVEILSASY